MMEQMKTDSGAAVYQFAGWMIQYVPYARFAVGRSPEWIEWSTVPLDGVRAFENAGFVFDKTPVVAEYTNLLAERQSSMWPIKYGVVPYDEFFSDAIRKMKAAGLHRVVAEYQRQYDVWKAQSK